jgi:hypothetical protein
MERIAAWRGCRGNCEVTLSWKEQTDSDASVLTSAEPSSILRSNARVQRLAIVPKLACSRNGLNE